MILGVDFGLKNIGLAISEGEIAQPLKTVPANTIFSEIERLKPEKIVVGISEKNMAKKTLVFVKKLRAWLKVPIVTVDETLTSWQARQLKKDRTDEHATSAALILQRHLDNNRDGV